MQISFAFLITFIIPIYTRSIYSQLIDLIESHSDKEKFKYWHYITKKPYDLNTEEGINRYKIFKDNIKHIQNVNEQNLSYKLGLGPFTDYTKEEFMSMFPKRQRTRKMNKTDSFFALAAKIESELEAKNKKIDWSSLFPDTKNQEDCSSCWAFAAIGSIEALISKDYNYTSLSEQQLVDCARDEKLEDNCERGHFVDYALDYIVQSSGVSKSETYPYLGKHNECKKDIKPYAAISEYYHCQNDEREYVDMRLPRCTEKIIINLINKAPYASDIEVQSDLAHYKEGDFLNNECHQANHSVLVVQYDGTRFKIRNSWGSAWGENGYAYIDKKYPGSLKACGLFDFAYQPIDVKLLNN